MSDADLVRYERELQRLGHDIAVVDRRRAETWWAIEAFGLLLPFTARSTRRQAIEAYVQDLNQSIRGARWTWDLCKTHERRVVKVRVFEESRQPKAVR